MSTSLREAVRTFLVELAELTPIDEQSTIGQIRKILRHEDHARENYRDEPKVAAERDLAIARLALALGGFKKNLGPHYVGCDADRTGRVCSPACIAAQTALDTTMAALGRDVVGVLEARIHAVDMENRRLRGVIHELRVSLGRKIGRPRKSGSTSDAAGTPEPPIARGSTLTSASS